MIDLSPAANAVWESFNEDEAGVFVDYGEKLAAALEALADWVVPDCLTYESRERHWPSPEYRAGETDAFGVVRHKILAIAAELSDNPEGE